MLFDEENFSELKAKLFESYELTTLIHKETVETSAVQELLKSEELRK